MSSSSKSCKWINWDHAKPKEAGTYWVKSTYFHNETHADATPEAHAVTFRGKTALCDPLNRSGGYWWSLRIKEPAGLRGIPKAKADPEWFTMLGGAKVKVKP